MEHTCIVEYVSHQCMKKIPLRNFEWADGCADKLENKSSYCLEHIHSAKSGMVFKNCSQKHWLSARHYVIFWCHKKGCVVYCHRKTTESWRGVALCIIKQDITLGRRWKGGRSWKSYFWITEPSILETSIPRVRETNLHSTLCLPLQDTEWWNIKKILNT